MTLRFGSVHLRLTFSTCRVPLSDFGRSRVVRTMMVPLEEEETERTKPKGPEVDLSSPVSPCPFFSSNHRFSVY